MNIKDLPVQFFETDKPLPNRSEEDFRKWAKTQGVQVMKKGWFDLLCMGPDGEIFITEIKSRSDRLKKEQVFLLALLEKAGIPCYIGRPYKTKDKLERFSMDMWDVKNSELMNEKTAQRVEQVHQKDEERKASKKKAKKEAKTLKQLQRQISVAKKKRQAMLENPNYSWPLFR